MPILRAMVELQKTSGTPQDVIVNRFHFDADLTVATVLDLITTELQNFYQRFDEWLSPTVALTGHSVTFYNMNEAEPRVPIGTRVLALSAVGTAAMPDEVALCLSFQALRVSGLPQSRRRNRVYLGPFAKAACQDSNGRPQAQTVTNIASSADLLLDASIAAPSWEWVVRSETTSATAPVDDGWVDNAWDTQRRRGIEATSRTTFT